jgi:hypothetical protein
MIIKSLNKTLYFNGVPLLYGKYSKKNCTTGISIPGTRAVIPVTYIATW